MKWHNARNTIRQLKEFVLEEPDKPKKQEKLLNRDTENFEEDTKIPTPELKRLLVPIAEILLFHRSQ
jgi:hypothetical protein